MGEKEFYNTIGETREKLTFACMLLMNRKCLCLKVLQSLLDDDILRTYILEITNINIESDQKVT